MKKQTSHKYSADWSKDSPFMSNRLAFSRPGIGQWRHKMALHSSSQSSSCRRLSHGPLQEGQTGVLPEPQRVACPHSFEATVPALSGRIRPSSCLSSSRWLSGRRAFPPFSGCPNSCLCFHLGWQHWVSDGWSTSAGPLLLCVSDMIPLWLCRWLHVLSPPEVIRFFFCALLWFLSGRQAQ